MSCHRKAGIQFGQLLIQPIHDGRSLVLGSGALLERPKAIEEQALIGAVAIEAGATDHTAGNNVVFLVQNLSDLRTHLLRLRQGGTVLKLENADAITLIFLRDECGGQGIEGNRGHNDAAGQAHQDQPAAIDQQLEQLGVGLLKTMECVVETIEDRCQTAACETEEQHPNDVGTNSEGC